MYNVAVKWHPSTAARSFVCGTVLFCMYTIVIYTRFRWSDRLRRRGHAESHRHKTTRRGIIIHEQQIVPVSRASLRIPQRRYRQRRPIICKPFRVTLLLLGVVAYKCDEFETIYVDHLYLRVLRVRAMKHSEYLETIILVAA